MKNIFSLFKIRKEEWIQSIPLLLIFVVLNILCITKYIKCFSNSVSYFFANIANFHISGFDTLTYSLMTSWGTLYNVYRHPLLAFFMYPFYLLNQGLMWLIGFNCAQFIVAIILIFCALYSFLFILRIFSDVVKLNKFDSLLLSYMFFSFAYIMVALIVPDHFAISLFLLLFVLYYSGLKMMNKEQMTKRETILLFIATAGVSLNNGAKIFFSNLFVNKSNFFRPLNLILAVILPCILIWEFAELEYKYCAYPAAKAKKQLLAHNDSIQKQKKKGKTYRIIKKHNRDVIKPMAKGSFMKWTDVSTPRGESIVENLFGESIQLHKDYLLGDSLIHRPTIVHYNWWICYIVESIIVILFVIGVWCGRHSRFLWLCISFFAMDMIIHLGLGFGLNEVYIMASHWLYVVPIAIAYLYKILRKRNLIIMRTLVISITLYLLFYNIYLLVGYLT